MPSPISFPSIDCPPAAPGGVAPSNNDTSKNAPDAFDRALTQAAPAQQKPTARTSVTGTARPSPEKTKASDTAEEPSEKDKAADSTLLSPEELAALLALIGAPAALPPPPPLQAAIPTDFIPATNTLPAQTTDADAVVDTGENFSAPQLAAGKDDAGSSAIAQRAQDSAAKPAFTLDAGSDTAGLTARDLLKQGAEVIDYLPAAQTPAAPSPAANAASITSAELISTAPTPSQIPQEKAAAQAAETSAVATGEQTTLAQESAASVGQSLDDTTQRRFSKKASEKAASEKIAALANSRESDPSSGVQTSIEVAKNNFLNVEDKQVKRDQPPVGTNAANWGDSMNPDARSTPFAARLLDGALSLFGTSQAATAAAADRSFEPAAPTTASAPHAAQIVSEIRDIADGLWAVERNSVEVRFHFNEHERLSVKVEYRDGVVQTTFRTDSPGLRDTIAREWQTQVASASDNRPYRVADPVFNTPPADARGFSLGGDSSRQQRQAEQSSNAQHTFATTSGRGSPSRSAAVAAPAARIIRPETALHLHTFA